MADLDYNEAAQKAALRRGLSEELKDALMVRDVPTPLGDFVRLCQLLDTQIRASRAEKQGSTLRSNHPGPSSTQSLLANPSGTNSGY